jgi:hypothetical protein
MTRWQLGEKNEARRCYDQAVANMTARELPPPGTHRLRAEAADLLGIARP